VKRAAAVSVPFSLEAGARLMERGFARVYVRHFLKTLTEKSLKKLELYPDLCDRQKLLAARSFWEFDDALTGPVHGFAGAQDYYERSSSIGFLRGVRVPTLLLSSWDDPFLPSFVLDKVLEKTRDNPNLHAEFSHKGGHVGWIEGSPWSQRYYMEGRVVSWLAAVK
jgi:predicted alpha/beta-fold hydrolase